MLRWPVLLLAVPAALLGLVGFVGAFTDRLRFPTVPVAGSEDGLVHLGPGVLLPLAFLLVGAALVTLGWRRDRAADPATALGPLRPVFARAFRLDDVQNTVVVRPVRALARAARTGDDVVVDGAVEGSGRAASGLGAGLAALHRAALPRAAAGVLAGALLIGLAAALLGVNQ